MKITNLVAIVTAGRTARDAKSLFDKMLGSQEDLNERRNYPMPETEGLHKLSGAYLQIIGGFSGSGMNSKIDSMLSYGCWCQIRNQQANGIVAGHGAPVDALDEACKAWHQCRTCTALDFSNNDEACDGNDVIYDIGFKPGTPFRFDCQVNRN